MPEFLLPESDEAVFGRQRAISFESIEAFVKAKGVEASLNHAVQVAADHRYNCRCEECLLYFSTSGVVQPDITQVWVNPETGETFEYDGGNDYGPFSISEINHARQILGRDPVIDPSYKRQ